MRLTFWISSIEVKSGQRYTLNSLRKCIAKYSSQLSTPYVLHDKDVKTEDGIVYLPLYMTPLLWMIWENRHTLIFDVKKAGLNQHNGKDNPNIFPFIVTINVWCIEIVQNIDERYIITKIPTGMPTDYKSDRFKSFVLPWKERGGCPAYGGIFFITALFICIPVFIKNEHYKKNEQNS